MDIDSPGPDKEKIDRCRYFQDLFSPYIHGELVGSDRRALAEHIRDCEHCSEKFGLSWKAIGAAVGDLRRFGKSRVRGRPKSIRAWVTMGLVAVALLLLWSSGMTGSRRGLADVLGERGSHGTIHSMGEIVGVLYRMLRVATDPPPGSAVVSNASRAEMRGFFRDLVEAGKTKDIREIEWLFHGQFRAVDNRGDGRDWSRDEFLIEINERGLPNLLPVSVHNASRNAIYLSLAWGDRAANAILLRKESDDPHGTERNGFKLTYLLFTR